MVTLFGGTPRPDSDGVSLTTLGGSDVDPVDLQRRRSRTTIARTTIPDLITNVALSLRTIFATVPYYVYTFGNDVSDGLPSILSAGQIVFDGLYVATNVPAQIVALLTGVTGASIFPLLPPRAAGVPAGRRRRPRRTPIMLVCGVAGIGRSVMPAAIVA